MQVRLDLVGKVAVREFNLGLEDDLRIFSCVSNYSAAGVRIEASVIQQQNVYERRHSQLTRFQDYVHVPEVFEELRLRPIGFEADLVPLLVLDQVEVVQSPQLIREVIRYGGQLCC